MGTLVSPEAFRRTHKVLPKSVPPGGPLFFSDFEHGSDIELLEPAPTCVWSVRDGMLVNEETTGGGHIIRVKGLTVENVLVRYEGKTPNHGNHIYLAKPGTVTGHATGNGYLLGFDVYLGRVHLYRVDNGAATWLAFKSVALSPNTWYPVEAVYADGKLRCRVFDGAWHEVVASDATYAPPFEVSTWCYAGAAYRNVEVHRL